MADSLLGAVKQAFEADPTLGAMAPGGLWTSEVPEDTELPYVCLDHEGTEYRWTASGGEKRVEQSVVCFHVYAAGAESAEEVAGRLVDVFKRPGCLSFDSKRLMAMVPLQLQVQSTPGRFEDGHLVYLASLRCDVKVSSGD